MIVVQWKFLDIALHLDANWWMICLREAHDDTLVSTHLHRVK